MMDSCYKKLFYDADGKMEKKDEVIKTCAKTYIRRNKKSESSFQDIV